VIQGKEKLAMRNTHVALIACSVAGLIALLALPWVGSDGDSITLLDIIKTKAHGYQVAYFVLAPLVLALAIGAAAVRRSYRWMTGVLALLLVIPAFLSAVASHAALGAHICAAMSFVAIACAIVLTIRPRLPVSG
jgi:hypothetical protein